MPLQELGDVGAAAMPLLAVLALRRGGWVTRMMTPRLSPAAPRAERGVRCSWRPRRLPPGGDGRMSVIANNRDVAGEATGHKVIYMNPSVCITPAAPSPLPIPYRS